MEDFIIIQNFESRLFLLLEIIMILIINSKILDIGCAKGFMLYDMCKIIPGITVKGIDISSMQ